VLGFEFQRRLERYMEREVKRVNDAVAMFVKIRERRRAREQARGGGPSAT